MCHLAADRAKRLPLNRPPLFEVRQRFEIEKGNSSAGLSGVVSLGKSPFDNFFFRDFNLNRSGFLGGN